MSDIEITSITKQESESLLDEIADFQTEKCSYYYPHIKEILEQVKISIQEGL